MMSYDRQQREPLTQQHPTAMMSQSVPSAAGSNAANSNLSPTQSQLNMQTRSQIDSMRSISQQPQAQQPGAVTSWSAGAGGYAAQPPSQSTYSSVMNPYMPYGGSSAVQNHASAGGPSQTRPSTMGTGQKPSTNLNERIRATYPPPHATSIYSQAPPPPPPSTGSTNGSYYGYDSYYNQMASQASSDTYLSHPSSAAAAAAAAAAASASSHWPSSASSNQMISNSSTAQGSLQPSLRPQTNAGSGGSMSQQQPSHPPAMMPQSVPTASSTSASNLSPTHSQLSMQGRSQLDSMRSMSQQPSAVSNWSNSGYYGQQPNQSPYPSVMNPYMPYGSSSTVSNHSSAIGPSPTRPTMGSQKPAANGSERARSTYPPHGTSIYGQPPPPPTGSNGSYYGAYDPYYPVAGQASDSYLSHPSSGASASHWPSPASSNQMISNSSTAPGSIQPTLLSQTGSSSSNIHPQSPSASSASLPPLSTRPPAPSQTPDRSPAPQLSTSYPSPNQGSSSKSTSNSLAQLEQMVMPNSGQNTTPVIKSPTHRSSASSPSTNAQQQLQYSYNSSGQGSYFSTGANATPNQSSYYPQYESSGVEMQKPGWPDQGPPGSGHMNPPGPVMMESAQSSYGQTSYDGNTSYPDYISLSAPSSSLNHSRFSSQGDTSELHPSEKGDPYAIDSQTFDDYDEQSSSSKTKKSRAKKGDDKVKKERKPRAPRASKAGTSSAQPQSPAATSSLQTLQTKPPHPPQASQPAPPSLDMSPAPPLANSNSFPSPSQQMIGIKQSIDAPLTLPPQQQPAQPQVEPIVLSNSAPSVTPSKSPVHKLSTESPSSVAQSQQMQYSYSSSGQSNYYSATPNVASTQTPSSNYYPPYESGTEVQPKPWSDATPSSHITHPIPPVVPSIMDSSQTSYQQNYDSTSPYGDFTALSAPNNSASQPRFPTPSGDTIEGPPIDINDSQTMDQQVLEDSSEPSASSKSKKSRSKKGDEKVKKERKPRAVKGSKAGNSSAEPQSPASIAQTPALVSIDTMSTPSVSTSHPSPNQQGYPTRSSVDSTGHIETSPQSNSGLSPTPLTKSPIHRLSTESPVSGAPPQTQYSYGESGQSEYFNTSANQTGDQANYFTPQYDSSGAEIQKPAWVGGSMNPVLASGDSQSNYEQANYDASTIYPDYNQLPASENNAVQPRAITPCDNTELTTAETGETQAFDTQTTEEASIKTPTAKLKRSRAKKSGERPRKDRKSRAAKTSQAPVEKELTPSPPTVEETAEIEVQVSQSTLEATSVAEPKPKRIRIRDSSSKGKKKLPKFALKFAKTKKRKRLGSSDNDQSDLDKTPPPSPDEVESGVQKRRSARNTKKLKYNDDIALGFSDSDDESQVLTKSKKISSANVTIDGESTAHDDSVAADEPTVFAAPVEDTMVVEKIMATRTGQRELEPEPGEVLPPDGTHIEVEEFYVKYKNLSYLHCDWRTLEELEKGDRRVAQKIKRYKQKKDSSNLFSFMDEEAFDPQYCEVDRILAVNEVEEMVPDESDVEEKVVEAEAEEDTTVKIEAVETSEKSEVPSEAKVPTPLTADEGNKAQVGEFKDQDAVQTSDEAEKAPEEVAEGENITAEEKPVDVLKAVDSILKDEITSEDDKVEPEFDSNQEIATVVNEKTSFQSPEKLALEAAPDVGKPKKMKKKVSRHYLVKWRALSYEDSTWELEDDLDPDKIKYFERFKDPPPKSKWKTVKRPKPEEWVRKEASPVYKNSNTLREYQLEGINWLSFCWHQGRNCILADEMGLGKTIQSIAFVNEIHQYGINGPFLIIVPLSTVGNWAREFETWTDLNVITYHGSSTSREMLKEYEMFYRNDQGNRITSYYKFQVMITTFEIILSDCLDLREIPWRCCIIDEAHRLKNRNCKLLEGLRLLNMEHRVLLTGTPLQNNVEELFSLLNFLEPNQFSSTEQFLQEFGDLKTEAQVDKLKLILKPMMLRRLKEDVEKTLAPKEETIVEVELTNIQKKYYRAILEKNFSFLSKGSSNNNMPNLMNTMMELRKCCIHPYLINGAEEQIMYEARQSKLAGGEPLSSFQAMVNSSGKLVLIDKLLPRLRADGHRVLIFSQMVRCLDILEDYVTHKHYPFERIDGRVRGSDRQQAIDRFSKPGSDRFVFLLCTRAGGLGINLTAADTVIIFDSDWNPQNDLQAQARCHRIGQSKAVKIYRLICRNTYEREMFDKASLKLGLDKAVLQSMNTQKGGAGGVDGQLTKKEIEELLRKGAYGALMDDDNAGDKFCEEDIDQILQRRTQVITIDNSEAKGSTFSKATFSSSNNREDIELDDPNFWEKWAKKANIDSDDIRSKDELIQLAPRRRTQTKRYGADGNLLDISDLDSSEEDEETISMRTRGSRGRNNQPKLTPSSVSKRTKRNKMLEFEDEQLLASLEAGYWSKGDCLKVEKGLLTYGWGRWEEIIASNSYKRDITVEECESMCRVILLYCLNNYKGDEKIKSFAWELITPEEEINKAQSDIESTSSTRGRSKAKTVLTPSKKTVADEIADAKWPKEAKYDPLIALPDDQYRRHIQRNSNRLLIRVKLLHYLKNDILKEYIDKILADFHSNEIDLPPVPVDGDLPAAWWDDDADKSLLIGIFKHGHDKFNLMRQDPNLCFLHKCGPPNKDDLMAEMSSADRTVEDFDEENRDLTQPGPNIKESIKIIKSMSKDALGLKDADAGEFLENLVDEVVKDLSGDKGSDSDSREAVDENKNRISKSSSASAEETYENGINDTNQMTKMDITDDESLTNEASVNVETTNITTMTVEPESNEFAPFPTANDMNQRFRRLITAYQRNSKKIEIKLAQKARDELKKERTSKFEAAKNEREERKRSLAQKWSRREEADFFRAISSFGVEYDSNLKKHDWNKFRSIGKLDKKLDETLEEYYKAFVIMCKKVTTRPLTADEEKCPISVDTITEDRASRCLSRIEFLSKIREQIMTHPELDERLKLCLPQSDLPDWWENGKHDKELLLAAAKHGLTRLDYNLAHDPTLVFDSLIKQKAEHYFKQPTASILIPLEQLQELLERNGIEYLKDLDLEDDSEDIKAILTSLLDSIELEEPTRENELFDGKVNDENFERSLLASSLQLSKIPAKATRSSSSFSNLSSRPLPNIIARRGANTVVKSGDLTGSSPNSVRLTSVGGQGYRRVAEITPIMPDHIPDEPTKSFEAGEISLTVQSESALLQLDDRAPIVLLGAKNPISAKIRWPKDKAIQTRLENLVILVEKNEWPSPPRPVLPTITLPNNLTPATPATPLNVTTSSPTKTDKPEAPLGSPKSDISNISSRTSKQDTKERSSDVSTPSRGRRGRGRKPRQPEPEKQPPPPPPQEVEPPREDRQAAAKLRNLLSQGQSSTRAATSSSTTEKLTAKFGGNKQGAGLSSLLASFKQKRADGSGSSRGREDKNLLDLNAPGAANLLPQILANMKPEFRDLLANQDAATMLLNSLTSMTSAGNVGTNLRSSNAASAQVSLDNLLNATRSTSKGPPPAHQRSDNPPSAHGSSSSRELRRNSQSTRESSPPSINLRSTRGKGSLANLDSASQQKPAEMAHSKASSSKKRGRPSSSASESPPGAPGADVLDLSSLPVAGKGASRVESRSRRNRDQGEELHASTSARSSTSIPTKANLKAGNRQPQPAPQEPEQPSDKGGRTTRASKRIGSRIDALALNLQAKKLHRGDSPPSDLSPSLPKEKNQDSPMAAHGSSKSTSEHKSQGSKAPPAAHSGHHKSSPSSSSLDQHKQQQQQREKSNQVPVANLPSQTNSSNTRPQDPLAPFMSNPSSLLAGLNPGALGGAGDLMNQLLRKAGTNDIVKNLLNEFMKNPSLALDPSLLASLTASMPMNTQTLPNFNPHQLTLPTTLPSTSNKTTSSSSLLNDFKSPSNSNSLMKRSRQESSSGASRGHSGSNTSSALSNERRSSSSTVDRHERRSSSSSSSSSDRRSSYQERPEKHGKHDKRSSGSGQQESSVDTSSSRRSSSLLAQQVPPTQQTSQVQTSSTSTPSQSALPNASTLNLANQFGSLNSLGGLLGFPGMNELMKQMSNFPGLASTLPRVSNAPVVANSTPTINATMQNNSDKGSRRSRQSGTSTAQTANAAASNQQQQQQQQQAANAALANSIMNLASQPSAASNPYSNYTNPLANPFLPFSLANLGMNNPLSMGLFPNLYMPSGFPTPDQQQPPPAPNQQGSTEGGSKDKKMRYPRK